MEIQKDKLIEWFDLKGLSETSIQNYLYYFNRLDLNKIDREYLLDFLGKYNNVVARAFIKNLLYYIKVGDFSDKIKEFANVFEIPKLTGRKKIRLPDVLTRDEVHSIANQMKSQRDRIMVLLTYYCGLRVGELLNIKALDFNWNNWLKEKDKMGRLKVIGKGDKQRNLPVLKGLMEYTYDYLKKISPQITPDTPIFRMGERHWQNILAKASKKAIDKHVNPHLLRHSCATYLIEKGFNLKEVADFLGQKTILTTQIYIHIKPDQLNKKVEMAFEGEEDTNNS